MRYVLLQCEERGQIRIIDNSTHIGKGQVEDLCMKGYKGIGTIESDLRPLRLLCGFNVDSHKKLAESNKKLSDIQEILER